jgi:serine/threonine-protein kinase
VFDGPAETATGKELPDGSSAGPSVELARGTDVGRYVILGRIGQGGMGVVYAAYDSDLDRKVALKFLQADRIDVGGVREMRLLREAQAMARLSHPNVVAVYELGSFEDHVFLAMEFVDGVDLGEWLARKERTGAEILGVFLAAGRGLAAAHAAGILHRDFKPANILVDQQHRPRVSDFGVSRAIRAADDRPFPASEPEPDADAAGPSSANLLTSTLTRTGHVHGTLAYMSPEHRSGSPTDERSDQFSFCVALYEALYGEHPFRGASPAELADGVLVGQVNPAPPDSSVPRWCRKVLLRGLRGRAEERFPSMEALLAALDRPPSARRRVALAAAAAAVAGVTALGVAFAIDSDEDLCTAGRDQLARVWSRRAADGVTAAFLATGRPHARSSSQRVVERLDAYTGEWAATHRATCLASVKGEQSPDLLDRRMACLGRRLVQVEELVELFSRRAEGDVVDKSVGMIEALEPPPACADSSALLARVAPPAEPARRARVDELERRVARAEFERQAGRPQVGLAGAREVLEAERPLGYAPVAAQAERAAGRCLRDLGQPAEAREALLRAQLLAERAGDIRLGAAVLVDLFIVVGMFEERRDEARLLARLAEAALERADLRGDLPLRAELLETRGNLANDAGELDEAVALLRQALAIRRQLQPPVPHRLAATEGNLARALSNAGKNGEARVHYREAVDIIRRHVGDQHPLLAISHLNLGVTYIETEGDMAEARKHFLAALAILDKVPDHRTYPTALANLGELENQVGNRDQAATYMKAALAIRLRRLGPDHPEVARSEQSLGTSLRDDGDAAGALEHHRRALAIYEKSLGRESADHAVCLSEIGEDLRRLGRPAESLDHQRRAIQVLSGAGQPLLLATARGAQGLALFDLGRRREAIPLLERAIEKMLPASPDRARAAFALARALEPGRARTARAKALAEEALKTFTAVRLPRERDDVRAYLRRGQRAEP